jgi:hypothetical protein
MVLTYLYLICTYTEDGHCHGVNTPPPPPIIPIIESGTVSHNEAPHVEGRAVLRIRIRDGRKSASGSGIRDEQPGSYFLVLRNHFFAFLGVKILKFFDEDPRWRQFGSRIRDPGWEKVGSGIRDKHPGSATLGQRKPFLPENEEEKNKYLKTIPIKSNKNLN